MELVWLALASLFRRNAQVKLIAPVWGSVDHGRHQKGPVLCGPAAAPQGFTHPLLSLHTRPTLLPQLVRPVSQHLHLCRLYPPPLIMHSPANQLLPKQPLKGTPG